MAKINKRIIIPSFLVTAFMIAAIYGTGQVFAEDVSSYPPIVQKIASKFGLKEDEVNEVFEQEKADMWEKRKQFFNDKLDQAVNDGKISEEQKQKILEKRDEIQADHEAERNQNKEDLQQWMKGNGIDPTVLMPYFGFGGFEGRRFHHFHMMN